MMSVRKYALRGIFLAKNRIRRCIPFHRSNMEDRFIQSSKTDFDSDIEYSLRPKKMSEFVGQQKIKENLLVYITAAKQRNEALDHTLLYGPPGLGKTTLAQIIANELGVSFKITSGPAIERAADLAAILTNLSEHDVLFIDEIHGLNRAVEEVLYPALEDYSLDFVIGKGPSAKSVRLPLPKFTLIGATTRAGTLTSPLRDRFGVIFRLEMYSPQDLVKIINRSANVLNIEIEKNASEEISKRSRGTPRIANRLLKRVRDFCQVYKSKVITKEIADKALTAMEVDKLGLDNIDITLLNAMINKFNGGPVGLDTLSAAINEDKTTIEDVYEPYLMQLGFISKTPRGRIVLPNAYKHLGLKDNSNIQTNIFEKTENNNE